MADIKKTDAQGLAKTQTIITTQTHATATHIISGVEAETSWQIYNPIPDGWYIGFTTAQDFLYKPLVVTLNGDTHVNIYTSYDNVATGANILLSKMFTQGEEVIYMGASDDTGIYDAIIPEAPTYDPVAWIAALTNNRPEILVWNQGLKVDYHYRTYMVGVPDQDMPSTWDIQNTDFDSLITIISNIDTTNNSLICGIWASVGLFERIISNTNNTESDTNTDSTIQDITWTITTNPAAAYHIYAAGYLDYIDMDVPNTSADFTKTMTYGLAPYGLAKIVLTEIPSGTQITFSATMTLGTVQKTSSCSVSL